MLKQAVGVIVNMSSGQGLGTKSGISTKILAGMNPRVTLSKLKARRIYSPKGRIFDLPLEDKGSYIIDRALFDHELAGQAAAAGAEIMVNTRVTGLLTQGDAVGGVTTNRESQTEIQGRVVIAADGIRALSGGIPVWSGLSEKVKTADTGINMLLFNVKGVATDVIELHVGSFGFHSFINISDEEREEVFDRMTKADYVNFDVYENL